MISQTRITHIRRKNSRRRKCSACGSARLIVSSGWSCPMGCGRIKPPLDATVKKLKLAFPELVTESEADKRRATP